MMIRSFIAGAILLLGSVSSEAQMTVKEFAMNMDNPDRRAAMVLYAAGVGRGFFLYQAMLRARSQEGMGNAVLPLFCLPDNTLFAGTIALDAAKRVVETAKEDDTFEPKLVIALMEMFPCR